MRSIKLFATKHPDENADRHEHYDSAVDNPLRISRHGAAGQYVDALQKEDQTSKKKQNTEELHCNFHH
jgi:hypothetical protein